MICIRGGFASQRDTSMDHEMQRRLHRVLANFNFEEMGEPIYYEPKGELHKAA